MPTPPPSQPSPTTALRPLQALKGKQHSVGQEGGLQLVSQPEDYLASTHQPHQAYPASTYPLYAGAKLLDGGQAGSPWDLIPEGTVPGNPHLQVWGEAWPGAKGEKRVIQTHTVAMHTLSISRPQTPSPGSWAAEVLRTGKAKASLSVIPGTQAPTPAWRPLHPT